MIIIIPTSTMLWQIGGRESGGGLRVQTVFAGRLKYLLLDDCL